jgi:hypothetical protein
VSQKRVKRCCRSLPLCQHCPLRLAPAAHVPEQRKELATLVEEIFRGGKPTMPESVADALLSLALARHERGVARALKSGGRRPLRLGAR